MMKMTIEQLGVRIQKFFNDGVETTARKCKFVERASKLTGTKFLQALVFHSLERKEMTLSSISQSCLDLGVRISGQGIDERIDATAVAFLRELFEQAMERFRLAEPVDIAILKQFTGVALVDSTQISLPASMAPLFPGSGGNASTASLKIHLVFDYLHGHLERVEFSSGCAPDQGYRGHWEIIRKGALLLMDLGYFALDTFKRISDLGGYFLSRFQTQTALFEHTGERIDLVTLLAQQTQTLSERTVLIGSRERHRLPCRLVMIRLPQASAERQRQKAKANARRHGRTLSKSYLALLDWALFITNVPATMLHAEHVAALYRVRWQVELIFKMCKSFCGLDHITSLRPHRVLTELYARLIGVVLLYFLVAPFRLPASRASPNSEISAVKLRLILQRFARAFLLALDQADAFIACLTDFYDHVDHAGFKQKRRKSPNTFHALVLISDCYEAQDLNDSLVACLVQS
jgi:hypothetical protein